MTGPSQNDNAAVSRRAFWTGRLAFPTLAAVMNFVRCAVCLAIACLLGACASGGRSSTADLGAYSNRMHSRFYKAWVQPVSVTARRGKISVPVDVEIDPRGRVLSFNIKRSSGDSAVDASIAAVGDRIRKVAPPPGPAAGKPFRLRIFFELDVR